MSAESDFIQLLCSKTWSSNKDNTLDNPQFNKYKPSDWQYKLIQANSGYYPPEQVDIKIVDQSFTRDGYMAPHGQESDDIHIPDTKVYAFSMEVSGKDFQGKALLNEAQFIVIGDHAVSTPMVDKASGKSLIILVRIKDFGKNRLIMVNELIWSVQYGGSSTNSQKFYDIQKWYCCGYP